MSNAENVHRYRFPVRYHETDQMGVVHHGVYVSYFEVGRTEMMRSRGLDYAHMERNGTLLAVIETGLRHIAPARFGDEVVVETRLTEVTRLRMRFEYQIVHADTEKCLCTGFTELACVNRELTLSRIPQSDRQRMLDVISPSVLSRK